MAQVRTDMSAVYQKDSYAVNFDVKENLWPAAVYNKVFNVVPTDGAGVKETQLLGIDQLDRHEVEYQDISFEGGGTGWTWYGKPWMFSKGVRISYEAQQDDVKTGDLMKKLIASLTKASFYTKESFAASVFNKGGDLLGEDVFNGSWTGNEDSSGDLMYDGKPLFTEEGNERSSKGGGTYYNSVSSLSLNAANFRTIWELHTAINNREEEDRPYTNPCDTLLVHPKEYLDGLEITKTTLEMGKIDTSLNTANVLSGLVNQVIKWDYLDDAEDAWFLGKAQHEDFQFLERQSPDIMITRDPATLAYKASFAERYGIFLKNWRVWTRGGGTAA